MWSDGGFFFLVRCSPLVLSHTVYLLYYAEHYAKHFNFIFEPSVFMTLLRQSLNYANYFNYCLFFYISLILAVYEMHYSTIVIDVRIYIYIYKIINL